MCLVKMLIKLAYIVPESFQVVLQLVPFFVSLHRAHAETQEGLGYLGLQENG